MTVRGPKSASARPGPCTRPRSADALTRRELPSGPTSGRRTPRSSRRDADGGDGQATTVGCGGSSLTRGWAGWSRVGPTGPAQSPSCSEAAASTQGVRGTGSSGERIGGRARWRRHPGRRTRRRDRAGAGGLPARRRPQQDACLWICQRFARAYATGPLAPPHSSLCDPAFELWQHAAWWCCTGSRELAAPP